MMMFIWMCVMTSAMMPGGERLASMQVNALEAQVRASMETPERQPMMALGWQTREEERYVPPASSRRQSPRRLAAVRAPASAMAR